MSLPAIIFCNTDLVDSIKAVIKTQLFIDEEISGAEFDSRLRLEPTYADRIKAGQLRILVLRDLSDYTNRDVADVVIFFKDGLATVLSKKFGPPGKTLQIDRININSLLS